MLSAEHETPWTLTSFIHITKVCFDADPADDINTFPHVRSIELAQP